MPVFLSNTEIKYVRGETDTISPDHQIKLRTNIRRKLKEIRHDFELLSKHDEFKTGVQEVVDMVEKAEVEGDVIVD